MVYLQQDPKLFLYHPHETDRHDLPRQSLKPESLSPDFIRLTSGISIPSPPIRGFQSFRHPSATILIHGPPSAFSSSGSSNCHKGSCSSSSVGGSSKGNSSRSNMSILAAFAATAWQPHGAYQARPGPCMCKRYLRSIALVRIELHTLPQPTSALAVSSVTTYIFSSDGWSPIRAIWFVYISAPPPPATCKISLQY